MSHNVYQITWPRHRHNRVSILVEPKNGEGERHIFSVRGSINTGNMTFYMEAAPPNPKEEPDPFHKKMVGIMWETKIYDLLRLCEETEPPKRQYDRRGIKIKPNTLTRRSKEWVEEVILALRDGGIIETPDNMLLGEDTSYKSSSEDGSGE